MSVEFIGPFEEYRVAVDGWQVPYLEGHVTGDTLHLTLDNRLGFTCNAEDAESVVRFVADAIAIGLGYSCHPSSDMPRPPRFRHFRRLTGLSADDLERFEAEHLLTDVAEPEDRL